MINIHTKSYISEGEREQLSHFRLQNLLISIRSTVYSVSMGKGKLTTLFIKIRSKRDDLCYLLRPIVILDDGECCIRQLGRQCGRVELQQDLEEPPKKTLAIIPALRKALSIPGFRFRTAAKPFLLDVVQ